eukprot:1477515-Rhodomonas_salina.3
MAPLLAAQTPLVRPPDTTIHVKSYRTRYHARRPIQHQHMPHQYSIPRRGRSRLGRGAHVDKESCEKTAFDFRNRGFASQRRQLCFPIAFQSSQRRVTEEEQTGILAARRAALRSSAVCLRRRERAGERAGAS